MPNTKLSKWILPVLAGAQFMVVLDATIVNVALPAIRESLGFTSDTQLQWLVTAYALAFGGFLLLGGRLADLFGRRRILLAGIITFAVASLVAGLSVNPTMLIAMRVLQGIGGALLSPAALSLVLNLFSEGHERNKALGVWSIVAAGGGAVGLILGGVLTQYVDWRWIFFINVPVALLIVVAAMRVIPKSLPVGRQKVDVAGAVLITAGLMSFVYALAKVPDEGWTAGITLGFFALSIGLIAGFIVNELRVKQSLMKLSIFKQRNVTGGNIVQLVMPAAMFGMFFYLSIYMQQILGYSPTHAGFANIPFTIMVIIIASILGRNLAKINPKPILTIAPLFVAAGLLWFARLPVHANYFTDLLPGILLIAAGMAVVFVVTTQVTTSGVSKQDSGLVSGLLNTSQQIGGAIGLAVLTVVAAAATKAQLVTAQSPAEVTEAIVHGFRQGFVAAACFAFVGFLIALFVIHGKKPTKTDLDREAETEAEAFAAIPGA